MLLLWNNLHQNNETYDLQRNKEMLVAYKSALIKCTGRLATKSLKIVGDFAKKC